MNKKLGIQLFTVRDFMTNAEDIKETFTKLKKIGYSQAQTAGCAISYKEFGEIAKETGIEIVGTHDNFNMMVNDFEQSLENHKLLGTTNMGIGGKSYESLDDVKAFIEQANIVAQKAAKNGMKFTYHNHSHEFCKWENGKTTMDMLVEGFDDSVSFVLDTYWVQHGGADVREWIEKLAGKIDILHLKDMKRLPAAGERGFQAITEIGNGNLNWKGILETSEKTGVKYYVVEQDSNWVPNCFGAAKKSAQYLESIGF